MDILMNLVLIVSLILVGWYLREQKAKQVVNRLLVEHGITPEMQSKNIIVCYMETHGDIMYLYGILDDKFYAQAKSGEEMHKTLDKLYPGMAFVVPDDDKTVVE